MISPPLGAALQAARRLALPVTAEEVPLDRLLGRVLAHDVMARADLPAADSSVMDGWAVRAADLPGVVRVVGESRAGAPFSGTVGPGEAVRISTGALLPDGADTVLRVEDGAEEGGVMRTMTGPERGRDVRFRAEDLRRGDTLLRAGTTLNGVRVGAVAAAGHATAMCRVPPAVAVITTGSELVDAGGPVGHGTVFDSNRHGVRAQVEEAGGRVVMHVTVEDDPAQVRRVLADAVAGADLVVVAGGLSVGRHDHVRASLQDMGMTPAFSRLAMRPGRPTTLGTLGGCRVLAVPGNPASATVGVHLIGRALLGTEMPWEPMPLAGPMQSLARLDDLMRCRLAGGRAVPLPRQVSSSITSLAGADVLAWLPWGRSRFHAGDVVQVSRL